jgi:broad specificity phosphatase PhoE
MSKICDFSGDLASKKKKYKHYDFREFKRYC